MLLFPSELGTPPSQRSALSLLHISETSTLTSSFQRHAALTNASRGILSEVATTFTKQRSCHTPRVVVTVSSSVLTTSGCSRVGNTYFSLAQSGPFGSRTGRRVCLALPAAEAALCRPSRRTQRSPLPPALHSGAPRAPPPPPQSDPSARRRAHEGRPNGCRSCSCARLT